jgi:hypothetical protein
LTGTIGLNGDPGRRRGLAIGNKAPIANRADIKTRAASSQDVDGTDSGLLGNDGRRIRML